MLLLLLDKMLQIFILRDTQSWDTAPDKNGTMFIYPLLATISNNIEMIKKAITFSHRCCLFQPKCKYWALFARSISVRQFKFMFDKDLITVWTAITKKREQNIDAGAKSLFCH